MVMDHLKLRCKKNIMHTKVSSENLWRLTYFGDLELDTRILKNGM
jgi:hypothetical protein